MVYYKVRQSAFIIHNAILWWMLGEFAAIFFLLKMVLGSIAKHLYYRNSIATI